MADPMWASVDEYFADKLLPRDDDLDRVLATSEAAGLLPIHVSPLQRQLLRVLVHSLVARRVLEIGTLGGYSTICIAKGMYPGGKIVTLERDPKHASVARNNFHAAGLDDVIELREGPAAESLAAMIDDAAEPFDFVFIDADKASTADYFEASLRLSRPGTAIFVDNVVRGGKVADANSDDASVRGVRRFVDSIANDKRVTATAMQTVGGKSYDGFVLAVVG